MAELKAMVIVEKLEDRTAVMERILVSTQYEHLWSSQGRQEVRNREEAGWLKKESCYDPVLCNVNEIWEREKQEVQNEG